MLMAKENAFSLSLHVNLRKNVEYSFLSRYLRDSILFSFFRVCRREKKVAVIQ